MCSASLNFAIFIFFLIFNAKSRVARLYTNSTPELVTKQLTLATMTLTPWISTQGGPKCQCFRESFSRGALDIYNALCFFFIQMRWVRSQNLCIFQKVLLNFGASCDGCHSHLCSGYNSSHLIKYSSVSVCKYSHGPKKGGQINWSSFFPWPSVSVHRTRKSGLIIFLSLWCLFTAQRIWIDLNRGKIRLTSK